MKMTAFAIALAAGLGFTTMDNKEAEAGGFRFSNGKVSISIGGHGGFHHSGLHRHRGFGHSRHYDRGHYDWHDTSHYDYIPGHWVRKPCGTMVYIPGRYVYHQDGHWDYHRGGHDKHRGHRH